MKVVNYVYFSLILYTTESAVGCSFKHKSLIIFVIFVLPGDLTIL